MALSRKYYIKIAHILAINNVNQKLISDFCLYFAYDNPNFNTRKFKEYIEKNQLKNL